MTDLVTSAQMRSIERTAIDSGAVSGLALMERAGAAVVDALLAEWPQLAQGAQRAVVLCGPGNNGGDGFVIARLLQAAGWRVEVFLYGDAARLPPDAVANFRRWTDIGAVRALAFPTVPPEGAEQVATALSEAALVVDALFGTGLSRPVDGLAPVVAAQRAAPARCVAVDLPSGMFSDDPAGAPVGLWVRADLTVTFHRGKPAHIDPLTAPDCGRVVIADIGLEPWDRHRHDA